jgi:S-adenosylmethionine:tRNA ribosyltransferase-isomerase
MNVEEICIEEYNYNLPNERIAAFPLEERDASKLLVYQNGIIKETIYKNIAEYIPEKAMVIFNNTKVIHARLLFQKETGSIIEIFVLEPDGMDIATAMQVQQHIKVKCLIGGASKWKTGQVLQKELGIAEQSILLTVKFITKEEEHFIVQLEWESDHDFATIIEAAGKVPLPPYIKRSTEDVDEERYQTIYAVHNGSVAAPTAGLHFSPTIFQSFQQKNIAIDYVTLHVGAGTFKPVSASQMKDHHMHSEYISVTIDLLKKIRDGNLYTVAVGTTSLRTLESLYWLGVKVLLHNVINYDQLTLGQWEAYQLDKSITLNDAITALLNLLERNGSTTLTATTQLLIAPGYSFKVVNCLVTNFHQPKSTLLLLVAAATNGNWKGLYNYALDNDFRFLSYGDGCLIDIK